MAGRITFTDTILGRVAYIKIDGTTYATSSDGLTIAYVAEYQIEKVVGRIAPRTRIGKQYFRIDCMLPENTLDNLQLAWNLPGSITDAGSYHNLYLGKMQALTGHEIDIYGWLLGGTGQRRMRHWFFDQVYLFEPKAQQYNPAALATVAVSFFAFGNSNATAGQEFGYIDNDYPTGLSAPSANTLLLETGDYLLEESGYYTLLES